MTAQHMPRDVDPLFSHSGCLHLILARRHTVRTEQVVSINFSAFPTIIHPHSTHHHQTPLRHIHHGDSRTTFSARRRATNPISSVARPTPTNARANRSHEAAAQSRSREAGHDRPTVHTKDERSTDGPAASPGASASPAAATAGAATYPTWPAQA